LQQRQGEARGLAGAGLGSAEQVPSREDDGNGLRLDGGGFCVALLRDGTKQLGQQPEAFEGRTYDCLLMDRPAKDKPSKPVQADETSLSEIRGAGPFESLATTTVAPRIGGSANRMKRLAT